MKARTVKCTLFVCAAFWALPALAHHNSVDPEFIETMMPDEALEAHNAAVDRVLERLEDMGISTMAGNQAGNVNMDPSDMQQGATCSAVVDGVCDDDMGNDSMSGIDAMSGQGKGAASGVWGMDRIPPNPIPVP